MPKVPTPERLFKNEDYNLQPAASCSGIEAEEVEEDRPQMGFFARFLRGIGIAKLGADAAAALLKVTDAAESTCRAGSNPSGIPV